MRKTSTLQRAPPRTIRMGKKRKAAGHKGAPEKQNGFEAKGGKMRAYTTYEDLADSEDEFHIGRDKVMLDDEPDVKRRKKWQEEGNFQPLIVEAIVELMYQTPTSNPPTKKS